MVDFPLWRTPQGEPLECYDKIKLLNENLEEIETLMRDALEEAILMGGSEQQLRELLIKMIMDIKPSLKA